MIWGAVFFLATALTVFSSFGSPKSDVRAISVLLGCIWALSGIADYAAGVVDGAFFPAMDGLACAFCTLLWVQAQRTWIFAEAILFFAMTCEHVSHFSSGDFSDAAFYRYDLTLNILYALQLVTVAFVAQAGLIVRTLKKLGAAAIALLCSAALAHAQNCYSQADLTRVTPSGLRVIQQALPPASDTAASAYLPATEFVATNLQSAQTSTLSTALMSAKIWANRSDTGVPNAKPNPPDGPRIMVNDGVHGFFPCFVALDATATDAATQSKSSYSAGRFPHHSGKGWLDYTEAAGIPDANVLEWPDFVSAAPTICTGFFTNISGSFYYETGYVIEPAAKLSTVPTMPQGCIEDDWEVQDGHTDAQTKAVIAAEYQNIHTGLGRCLRIYTNPLNGPFATYNGIDGTDVDYLAAHVDQLGIYPFPKSGDTYLGSFNEQMAMFTSPPCAKFNLQVDMAMSVSDITALRAAAFDDTTCPLGGVELFYDGQAPGGDCSTDYNQKLAIILGMG